MPSPVVDGRGLRAALRAAYPWLDEPEVGPTAVDAGECDRCGRAPRCVPTCGPAAWVALCAACAVDVGVDAWCDGHRADAHAHLAWAASLPTEWATVVRLWWVATGEVRVDDAWLRLARGQVAPVVRAALPG